MGVCCRPDEERRRSDHRDEHKRPHWHLPRRPQAAVVGPCCQYDCGINANGQIMLLSLVSHNTVFSSSQEEALHWQYISGDLPSSSCNIAIFLTLVLPSYSSLTCHPCCKRVLLSFVPTCFHIWHYHGIFPRCCSCFVLSHTSATQHDILHLYIDCLYPSG